MNKDVRIEFTEVDRQWKVSIVSEDGSVRPGEPFAASAHKNWTKLEQVRDRAETLGYRVGVDPSQDENALSISLNILPA